MSPVEFKRTPCRPVDFNGQGPHYSRAGDKSNDEESTRSLHVPAGVLIR